MKLWGATAQQPEPEIIPAEPRGHDPLAPFRASGALPPAMPRHSSYLAFAATAGGRPNRLDIRPKTGMCIARLYSAITEIAYDREQTGILLVMPGKLIKIRGRGLRPIVDALLAGTCEYIAELADGETPNGDAPVIERIELVTSQAKDAPAS